MDEQGADSEITENMEQSTEYKTLQKNYDALYKKYKSETEQARLRLYIGIIVVVILIILLINVIIFERMKRRSNEEEENYLTACASNSESNEVLKEKKDSNKKVNKPTHLEKKDKKDGEIEFIDFDDL